MKLLVVLQARCLVLLCVLQTWIGSTNGCLPEGADYEFSLRLPKKLVSSVRGVARIPCAYTAPMRALSGQQVWFRGSPEFPLKSAKVEKRNGLMRPMISIEEECSVILRDAQDFPEEYGFMLKYGAGERHIFSERVKVVACVAKVKLTSSPKVFETGEKNYLTCSLSKRCLGSDPNVTWEGLGKGSVQEIPLKFADKQNKYSEILFYTPVPEDHQRKVTCKATFGRNLSASATLTLTVHSQPQIQNSSACTLQQDLLTCICESQGVPIPDIRWRLAQDKRDFTVVKSPARHITVRSTFTMRAGNIISNRPIMCESGNALGLSIKTLPVNVIEGRERSLGE